MSVVDFALRLAGDVSSFTLSVRTEMQSAIAAQAGVDPSAVMVTVTSGSVVVGVRILTPTAMATSVQSAVASAISSPSSATTMLASVTGISIAVLAVVTPPIVAIVAPPPPPSSPSPSPPPATTAGRAITILAIAVPAAIIGLLCCLAMVCWWMRRRQVKLRRKNVNHWLRNVSVSTVSADDFNHQEPPACSVVVAAASIPSGGGGGGGNNGGVHIEMSDRFDGPSSAKDRMTRAQELLKAFELDTREIRILEKLGEGGQGVVVRGWWHGMEVAIKQPRAPKGSSRGKQISPDASGPSPPHNSFNQALRREVRALSRVRHPNVIKLHGACFEPVPMILMSYAPSGTLQDALDNHKFQTPLTMVRVLAGIARGMEAVHAHKIIHLDLKPENVLIGPLDVPWITDFGLSTSANMTSMSQSTLGGRGTLPFKAPELFVHPPHVGPEADVYAFSILAWIVVCGEQPYAKMQAAATSLPQAVVQGVRPTLADPNEEWRDKTISAMVRLIEGCWHAEYTQRPTFGSGSAAPLDGSREAGGEGDKGAGSDVVAMLEKMEYSLSKGFELEASQLALATRLISTESEAEALSLSLVQISAVQGDATTTAAEQSDLAEEKAALETSQGLLRQHAFSVLSQMPGGTGGELASALSAMLQQQSDMFRQAMQELSELKVETESNKRSLIRLAEGELDCPRLFVLLPMEASSSKLMQLVKREFLKDKYRLVFLDPVTGCAVRCGPDGNGYKLEMPKKWLVENRKIISAGLRIVKMAAAAGCVAGLPLESVKGLPSQAVSKAEVEAVKMFERVYSGSVLTIGESALGDDASSTSSAASPSTAKAVKAATGRAYKQLRKMLKDQCEDEYLVHCEMTKEKANDGSIEFVSAGSKDRFLHFGQQCLIWNDETLKQKAAAKAAVLSRLEHHGDQVMLGASW
ncbi:serine threonine kinase [Chrysochromulina tobinii]|uniref:Serine threonine kinase n=1 Tax=Chrysochromulina tobinii TaxID=1460289 RepID=A0A0M0J7J3_9EUKA|nr:serine threonine kinase [Chrysochromulina tobinii]|eukprot:KOO22322.1 serine threonine kinase [Chrysochromulina sp. CCMP291]